MIWPEVKKNLDSNPSLSKEELYEAISLAGKFIARSADTIGRFSYVVNTNPDVKITPSYNMLRHAGAVYSLGMYYELSGDPEAHTLIVIQLRIPNLEDCPLKSK